MFGANLKKERKTEITGRGKGNWICMEIFILTISGKYYMNTFI